MAFTAAVAALPAASRPTATLTRAASPYAVFRAADLGWPSVAQTANVDTGPTAAAHAESSGTSQHTAPWATLIQGELFQLYPVG